MIEQQGTERDLIVSMHEAGHAVVCVRLGVPFGWVTIDGSAGVDTAPFAASVCEEAGCRETNWLETEGPTIGGSTTGRPTTGRPKTGRLTTGEAAGERLGLRQYLGRCRNQAVVCLAGAIAEAYGAQRGLTAGIGLDSGRKDERDARYFVQEVLRGQPAFGDAAIDQLPGRLVATLAQLRQEAEALVLAEFDAIAEVARQLSRKRRLSAADVARLMD